MTQTPRSPRLGTGADQLRRWKDDWRGEASRMVNGVLKHSGMELRRAGADAWRDQARLIAKCQLHPVIFDVGANVGQTAIKYLRGVPDATIHSFEPIPECYRRIVAIAGRTARVIPHQVALAERDGTRDLHTNPDATAVSSFFARPQGVGQYWPDELPATIQVPVRTVDGVCADLGISRLQILKLDTQGAESLVLQGAASMLASGSIDLVFTELTFVPHYEGGVTYHELIAQMEHVGYSLYQLYHLVTAPNGQLRFGDGLFISPRLRAIIDGPLT